MQNSFQVLGSGGILLDYHKASAGAGESLVLVTGNGALHFAHTLDTSWPRGDYVRVPTGSDDLNALFDMCLDGLLDAEGLMEGRLIAVGRRLGVMRTVVPPQYDIQLPAGWDDPECFVAIGVRDRERLTAPLVLWPNEWSSFRQGLLPICGLLVSTKLIPDPLLAAA